MQRSNLDVLASSIAARPLRVSVQPSGLARTDGAVIWVPDGPLDDLVASVSVQAALLALGSLGERAVSRVVRREVPAYLLAEALRAADVPHLLPRIVVARLRELPGPEPWLGTIDGRALRRGPGAEAMTELGAPKLEGEDEPSEAQPRSKLLDLLVSPLQSPALTKAMSKLGLSSSELEAPAGGSAPTSRRRRGVGSGAAGPGRVAPSARIDRGALTASSGTLHPEWDRGRQAHRPAWCRVLELDPPPAGADVVPHLGHPGALTRELARVGTTAQWRRHLPDGDTLDLSALIDDEVDRRSGRATEGRVFVARERTARDLGVLVLLDASGSTAQGTGPGSLFEEQRRITHDLIGSLEALGDRVGGHAFFSRGREAITFLRIKDFDGRFDAASRRRLDSVRPGGYTRMGAAVRHATHVIQRSAGTSHRLLVVVGDGFPYDDGYEGAYAREDTRMALREAVEGGVGCVSVQVSNESSDAGHDEVWSGVVDLRIDSSLDLGGRVRPAFAEALRAAGAQQRQLAGRGTAREL